MAKTIVGSFDTFEEARSVMSELQQRGFNQNDISIVANNATGQYRTGTTRLRRPPPRLRAVLPAVRLPVACSAARRA